LNGSCFNGVFGSQGKTTTLVNVSSFYLMPMNRYYINMLNTDNSAAFTVNITLTSLGTVCAENTTSNGLTCNSFQNVNSLVNETNNVTVNVVNGYGYVKIVAGVCDSVTISTVAKATLYAAPNFLPSHVYSNLVSVLSSSTGKIVINLPGSSSWYVGCNTSNSNCTLSILCSTCPPGNGFGANCGGDASQLNFTKNPSGTYVINATNNSMGKDTDKFFAAVASSNMQYFVLNSDIVNSFFGANAQMIRVSTTASTGLGTPMLYARLGLPPTANSFDFAVNGSYVNQVWLPWVNRSELPVNELRSLFIPDAWYVAVSGGGKYVLWGGFNCLNNCSNKGKKVKGKCFCNGQLCNDDISSAPKQLLTNYPTTTLDSVGNCYCVDSYNSYDCSARVTPTNSVHLVWIILIAVMGLIVVIIAVGAPLYFYIDNRRKSSSYENLT